MVHLTTSARWREAVIKASEIFLEYCAPLRKGMPSSVTIEFLRKAYMIPELVWNAVVLDINLDRQSGVLPQLLLSTLENEVPLAQRKESERLFKFWVHRKDSLFSMHRWPLTTEIFENVKKQVIVRVHVHANKNHTISIPKEWLNKKNAPIVPFGKL